VFFSSISRTARPARQPPREFVSARDLDNLLMSFIYTEALVATSDKETLTSAC
jgi:aspartyl aminopeptidase